VLTGEGENADVNGQIKGSALKAPSSLTTLIRLIAPLSRVACDPSAASVCYCNGLAADSRADRDESAKRLQTARALNNEWHASALQLLSMYYTINTRDKAYIMPIRCDDYADYAHKIQ